MQLKGSLDGHISKLTPYVSVLSHHTTHNRMSLQLALRQFIPLTKADLQRQTPVLNNLRAEGKA